MLPFWIALQFLSSLPVSLPGMPAASAMGRSLLYYPLVGLLFGALLCGLDALLVGAPLLLHAALLLSAWVLLSGGLHLDGLADSADAWLGGFGDRQRTLEIMKDPRSGPIAVVTLGLLLLLKFSALVALLQVEHSWVLLLAPMLARSAMLALFLTTPYVRAGGLGQALAEHLPRRAAGMVLLVTLVVGGLFGGWIIVAMGFAFWALRRLMLRRLGGTTGDTAGALLEVLEMVALVTAAL